MVSFCTPSPTAEATSLLSSSGGLGFLKPGPTTSLPGTDADFSSLSKAERERAYNELHCVAEAPVEDPDTIQQGLYELDCHVEHLKNKASGSAYRLAEAQDAEYVRNQRFRLMFLRADQYEPRRAAERTMRFYAEKLRLFGKDKLTKDILYQDLSEDDLISLYCGSMQFLPEKDRAGRTVFLKVTSKKKYTTIDSYLRAKFYMFMSCLDADESVQLKGFNFIFYKSDLDTSRIKDIRITAALRHALPMRITVGHGCVASAVIPNSIWLQSILRAATSLVDMTTVFSARVHCGTHTECMYALMGFGVPVSAMPFEQVDGECGVEYHRIWIEDRKVMDRQSSKERLSGTSTAGMSTESQDWSPYAKLDLSGDNMDPSQLSDSMMEDPFGDDLLAVSDAAEDLCTGMLPEIERMELDPMNAPDFNSVRPEQFSLFPESFTDMIKDGLQSMKSFGVNRFDNNDSEAHDDNPPAPSHAPDSLSHDDEATPEGGNVILSTTPEDVLTGRGKGVQKHPGNVFFRNLIANRINAYEAASKGAKTQIAIDVIDLVKGTSGRFLKPAHGLKTSATQGGEWEELDDHTARLKVAFTFRSYRKVLRRR